MRIISHLLLDYDEDPGASRSTSVRPTSWPSTQPPSTSTSKAGSKGPNIKSSFYKSALDTLEKRVEEFGERQGRVEMILTETQPDSSAKNMWGRWLPSMVRQLNDSNHNSIIRDFYQQSFRLVMYHSMRSE